MRKFVTKSRTVDDWSDSGKVTSWNGVVTNYGLTLRGVEAQMGFSNPDWIRYKRTGRKATGTEMGSEFVLSRINIDPGRLTIGGDNRGASSGYLVNGPFIPVAPGTFSMNFSPNLFGPDPSGVITTSVPRTALDAAGATAISRCAPTTPHANLSTLIGEIKKDGLPSADFALLRSADKGFVRSVASDNLKVQFETLPLISDIQDIHKAVTNSGRILAQYARDSDRSVHRRYSFPPVTTRTVLLQNSTGHQPFPSSYVWSLLGNLTWVRTVETTDWFSGSFRYHRAGNDTMWNSILQKYQDYNHLLGTGIGVSTAWELTPWSWAVDWFANTGDVFKNVQMMMNDGLIMEYGYMMRTVTTTDSFARFGARLSAGMGVKTLLALPNPWTAQVTRTDKFRLRANPFGFGVDFPDLSWRKMSILASLGITRDSRVP